jgi:hypothetical protein
MNARVSKISLIVFVVLLVVSGFLLSVAGDWWPWYAVMAVFASIPVVIGPGHYRVLGAVALLLSIVLIVSDINAGKHFQEWSLPSGGSIEEEASAPNEQHSQ